VEGGPPLLQAEKGICAKWGRRNVFEILGIAGITISMLAYVPQVVHFGKGQCSAGISRRAWAMWLVGSLLVGTLAVHRGDFVFIALQFSTLTSAAIILFLAQKYRGMVCETHAADPARELTATGGAPRRS
jgi:lipid-A-disaccharide synthase-like uncharacterized protein